MSFVLWGFIILSHGSENKFYGSVLLVDSSLLHIFFLNQFSTERREVTWFLSFHTNKNRLLSVVFMTSDYDVGDSMFLTWYLIESINIWGSVMCQTLCWVLVIYWWTTEVWSLPSWSWSVRGMQLKKKISISYNRYFDRGSSGWPEPIRTPNPTLGGGQREIWGNHVI